MGRGRQKAKHTKIARELKYDTYNVNFTALERELGHQDENGETDYVDKWADDYTDDEDDESAGSYQRQQA